MPTDLSHTYWKINDTPILLNIGTKNINFTSNENDYSSINISTDEIKYNNTSVYINSQQYAPYLEFSSPNTFTLAVYNTTKNWDGTLEYSTDTTNWSTWDGTTTLNSTSSGDKKVLYIRGSNNSIITGGTSSSTGDKRKWVLTGSDINCIGNMETILDYSTVINGQHPTMGSYCFNCMFKDCTAIISSPDLLSLSITDHAYNYMFQNCTNLITGPIIEGLYVGVAGCQRMFYGCTSLISIPKLPATTIETGSYYGMFYNCTSLIQAPNLPATTIGESSYQQMFSYCSSLSVAPSVLPALTLPNKCYNAMFYGCYNLQSAPTIMGTILTGMQNMYQMFYACLYLTNIQEEFYFTNVTQSCCQNMFSDCTSLQTIPKLNVLWLETQCYQNMFRNCWNLFLSETSHDNYIEQIRIPQTGTGIDTSETAINGMFANNYVHSEYEFTGTPNINTTYYKNNNYKFIFTVKTYPAASNQGNFTLDNISIIEI